MSTTFTNHNLSESQQQSTLFISHNTLSAESQETLIDARCALTRSSEPIEVNVFPTGVPSTMHSYRTSSADNCVQKNWIVRLHSNVTCSAIPVQNFYN